MIANRPPRTSRAVRAAFVRVGDQTIVVVEIKAWVIADPFEAQLAISAIELTCGRPVVLWATEPCGCRDLYGRREHIDRIDQMPLDSLDWQHVELDFAHPASPAKRSLN